MADYSTSDELKKAIINSYAEAYHKMGYSTLMGKIVALLLLSPNPMSLDEICGQLEMSKGPVSQITRRLRDHHLIEKFWVPGERKDYYRATADIFGQAFRNYRSSMRRNRDLAKNFTASAQAMSGPEADFMRIRMQEMHDFYDLMDQHNNTFLEAWSKQIQPEMMTES
jgi:HTH-type transcriptional regulator, osmoprotectant uptake regulator